MKICKFHKMVAVIFVILSILVAVIIIIPKIASCFNVSNSELGDVEISLTFLEKRSIDLSRAFDNYRYALDFDENNFSMISIRQSAIQPDNLFIQDLSDLNIDYDKEYAVISINRKIKNLVLDGESRKEKFYETESGSLLAPYVKVVFQKEYYPNTAFIYKMKKVDIRYPPPPMKIYNEYAQIEQSD